MTASKPIVHYITLFYRKASNSPDENDDPAEPNDQDKSFYEIGRLFGRMSDPYADVPHVVAVGIKNDTAADTDDEEWNEKFFQHIE